MRHNVLWMVVLLGLHGVATVWGTTGAAAQAVVPGEEPAIARAETPAAAPPALDLRVDPTQLPAAARVPPTGGRPTKTASGNPDSVAVPQVAGRGLSFDVELKPRSRVGNLAREDDAEDPGIEGGLERLVDRATLGVRGRYRF